MSVDPWGPVAFSEWSSVGFVQDRPATEDDVRNGAAVFYVQDEAAPHAWPSGLPALAIHVAEDGSRTPVIVVQAEQAVGSIVVGVRYFGGGNLVCTADELETATEENIATLLAQA
jgi:hypothetical protein